MRSQQKTKFTNQSQSGKQKQIKSKKKWWISGIVVALVLIIFFSFSRLQAEYFYLFKCTHFNKNDKVYATQEFFDFKKITSIAAYRLIRPLTEKEIDDNMTLIFNEEKRTRMKQNLSPSLKPYIVEIGFLFSKKKMQKQGTAYLGTYLDKTLVDTNKLPGINAGKLLMYRIKPNVKNVEIWSVPDDYHMPENYTIADSVYYVNPFMVGDKEPSDLKK